jgi:hypothetical protein
VCPVECIEADAAHPETPEQLQLKYFHLLAGQREER